MPYQLSGVSESWGTFWWTSWRAVPGSVAVRTNDKTDRSNVNVSMSGSPVCRDHFTFLLSAFFNLLPQLHHPLFCFLSCLLSVATICCILPSLCHVVCLSLYLPPQSLPPLTNDPLTIGPSITVSTIKFIVFLLSCPSVFLCNSAAVWDLSSLRI